MAERRVKCTKKDDDGDILALGNLGEYWSPRSKAHAINDIESNTNSYYVQLPGGVKKFIHVVKGTTGKYLRTNRDSTETNNLDDLPDC